MKKFKKIKQNYNIGVVNSLMETKKIILFGGTFDPIHIGHTTVAQDAIEKIKGEQLVFIPAKISPLKQHHPLADQVHRFKMIELAISQKPKFSVSDYELTKNSPCYTLQTVRYFKSQYPDSDIYWLLGADSLNDMAQWYQPDTLIDECFVCFMLRAGYPKPDFEPFIDIWGPGRVNKLREHMIETPLVDISSTDIREKLKTGQEVSDMLKPEVYAYILEHHLYQ